MYDSVGLLHVIKIEKLHFTCYKIKNHNVKIELKD